MSRPWQVWLIFASCALIVLATMGWFSSHAIEGDLMRQRAERSMQREQQINLALWRMDTRIAPLIAEEAARPHYFYESFYTSSDSPIRFGERAPVIPSPMLFQNEGVKLNFANSMDTKQWGSPQVPDEDFDEVAAELGLTAQQVAENRRRLEQLAENVDPDVLLKQLPKQLVPTLPQPPRTQQMPSLFAANQAAALGANGEASTANQMNQAPDGNASQSEQLQQIALPQAKIAKGLQQRDYSQRGSRFQGLVQQEFNKQRASNYAGGYGGSADNDYYLDSQPVTESLSKPLWINGQLLLARRIVRDGREGIQGSWLDWPVLKESLLSEVTDLLPGAELRPLEDDEEGDPARMLAGLPVELVVPKAKFVDLPSATVRWTLGLGWLALIIALVAVGALLWGVLALSERRAAFVSSVTHELRTPLTTFRMYSDMLARDMVPDAQKRQQYLSTLQREAERLTHLVENVLSYARLERGRGLTQREEIRVAALVERPWPRLAERANQADMQLELHMAEAARNVRVSTDVGVVEQILFNLVDNAAKYASDATDRTIHCDVQRDGNFIRIAIRDHGPGFEKTQHVRKSRPFSKSAEQAAVSKPGVGLGLALCRRLAKQLGGRLEVDSDSTGAAATLLLPLS